jgi:hypothetical protein
LKIKIQKILNKIINTFLSKRAIVNNNKNNLLKKFQIALIALTLIKLQLKKNYLYKKTLTFLLEKN